MGWGGGEGGEGKTTTTTEKEKTQHKNQLGSCKLNPIYPMRLARTLEEILNTKKEVVLLEMHPRGREEEGKKKKSLCKVCRAFAWL